MLWSHQAIHTDYMYCRQSVFSGEILLQHFAVSHEVPGLDQIYTLSVHEELINCGNKSICSLFFSNNEKIN